MLRYLWERPANSSRYDSLKKAGSREFVMGIGSHSGLLMNYCMEGQARPHNLAILEKRLAVSVKTVGGRSEFRVAEISGPCRVILEAPAALDPGSLTESDLGEACRSPLPLAPFMDLRPAPPAGEDSACVATGKTGFRLAEASSCPSSREQPKAGGAGFPGSVRLMLLVIAALGSVAVLLALARAARLGRRRRDGVSRTPLLPPEEGGPDFVACR
mmetsp:Transcript_15709/g.49440  ORF Transcript_15709/g.49440 Transcript_15709/m.49440 type:complete len:215 (-) Transcript_15709:63-707(-)